MSCVVKGMLLLATVVEENLFEQCNGDAEIVSSREYDLMARPLLE